MRGFADDLTEFLIERAGNTLRCVARFAETEYVLVYVRDDIEERPLESRVREVHSNVHRGGVRGNTALRAELGPVQASLQLRDEAVILYFPGDDGQGVLVSLEPVAASQLQMFVEECLQLM